MRVPISTRLNARARATDIAFPNHYTCAVRRVSEAPTDPVCSSLRSAALYLNGQPTSG